MRTVQATRLTWQAKRRCSQCGLAHSGSRKLCAYCMPRTRRRSAAERLWK